MKSLSVAVNLFFSQLWCAIKGHAGVTDMEYYSKHEEIIWNKRSMATCKKCKKRFRF